MENRPQKIVLPKIFLQWGMVLALLVLAMHAQGVPPARAATTLTVLNANDSGAGSLRQLIADAAAGDTITFDPILSGTTINLAKTLSISKDIIIDGTLPWPLKSAITISGQNMVRVFSINAGVTVKLKGLTITRGFAYGNGGGINNTGTLMVENSILSANIANGYELSSFGGGIYNHENGILTVVNSTFMNNGTCSDSALSESIVGGGGIANDGSLTVRKSTFWNNTAGLSCTAASMVKKKNTSSNLGPFCEFSNGILEPTGCVPAPGYGGAIYNSNRLSTTATATITSSTFLENGNGGGLYNSATASVTNSTFFANSTGIANYGALTITNSTFSASQVYNIHASLSFANNIMADLTMGDCYVSSDTIVSANINNLVEDGSCSDSGINFQTGDPHLAKSPYRYGKFAFGPIALLWPSPAIDAGDDLICASDPVNNVDQIGMQRSYGAHCDIGAYEVGDIQPQVETFTAPSLSYSLNIPITAFTTIGPANAYQITISPTMPAADAAGWQTTLPFSYTVPEDGEYTLYPWVKDSAGNLSSVFSTPVHVTVASPKELAVHGGLNTYTGTSKIPNGWVALHFRESDGKYTAAKREGTASVKMTGTAGVTKILTQTILSSGKVGNIFTFSFWAKGANIPVEGTCWARILFYNADTLKMVKTIPCKTGTYTSFEQQKINFTTTFAYTSIVIRFNNSKTSGTIWFDTISLLQ